MSRASERKAMRETLIMYPMMTVSDLAAFLNCSTDHARGLIEDKRVPAGNIGRGSKKEYRIDPLDAAVYWLADREGITCEEFWEAHGPEGTPEACRRLVSRIRRIQAAA